MTPPGVSLFRYHSGTQMVHTALELAELLKPGVVPTRPPATPFAQNPWSYGAVPPELD